MYICNYFRGDGIAADSCSKCGFKFSCPCIPSPKATFVLQRLVRRRSSSRFSRWLRVFQAVVSPKKLITVAAFANSCDSKSAVKATFLAGTAFSDDLVQVAALKQAWRDAEKKVEMKLSKITSDQSSLEDLKFMRRYSWQRIGSKAMGCVCDSLLGRVRRDFEALELLSACLLPVVVGTVWPCRLDYESSRGLVSSCLGLLAPASCLAHWYPRLEGLLGLE